QAVADPDPWRGFCRFIAEIARMQIADRGFTEAFLSTQRTDAAVGDRRRGAEAEFADLVDRAKQTGMLRDDFVVGDLAMVLLANSGLGAAVQEHRMGLSQRLVAYLLFAFGTEAARSQITLPPPSRMGIVDLYTAERRPRAPERTVGRVPPAHLFVRQRVPVLQASALERGDRVHLGGGEAEVEDIGVGGLPVRVGRFREREAADLQMPAQHHLG